ncbi:MAG: hypothetical protein IJY42_05035, partial [Clostridia bacterium]|nr:hypothetical protein [Clostridia bacterium]
MLAGLCRDCGVTVMAEGDVYPRPRYNVPASLLELFDFGLCADGNYDGLLKYMVDYVLPPEEETGYLRRHTYNLERKEAVSRAFSNGANCGVYVRSSANGLGKADLEACTFTKDFANPIGGMMCGLSSVPT